MACGRVVGTDTIDPFEPGRATDAVAMLVSFAGGRLNYTAALKLLYLADREALAMTGTSITGGTFYSMGKGPVISEVLQLIHGDRKSNRWSQFLETDGHVLVLKPGWTNRRVARGFEAMIRKHWEQHHVDPLAYPDELIEFMHGLPEWKEPKPGGRIPITHRQIWAAQKVPDEVVETFELQHEAWESMAAGRIIRD